MSAKKSAKAQESPKNRFWAVDEKEWRLVEGEIKYDLVPGLSPLTCKLK
jgi:hypothetical protein